MVQTSRGTILLAATLVLASCAPAVHWDPGARPSGDEASYWLEDGVVTAEVTWFDDVDALARWLERTAKSDPRTAARDAHLFADRTAEDLACVCLWVHVAPKARRLLRAGDLQFVFTDGFEARDVGVVLYAPPGSGEPPQDTARDAAVLLGHDDPEGKGRSMYVFLPGACVGRTIASVRLGQPEG